MKLEQSTKKYIIISSICLLLIIAITAILTYKPSGITASGTNGSDVQEAVSGAVSEQAPSEGTSEVQSTADISDVKKRPGVTRINIYTVDRDIDTIIRKYAETHWDFFYQINCYTDAITYSRTDIEYMTEKALMSGNASSIDMYCLTSASAAKFIKGEYSSYACSYKELGIDVDTAVKAAEIPGRIVEDGSNPDGELIALPYLANAAVFMYRRSVARDVWGTDEPDRIADIIGAGTQKWDKLIDAAQTLKEHGYYIVPGYYDLTYMVDTSLPLSLPGKSLEINPGWEKFADASKRLFESGCIKDVRYWTEQWNNELAGKGDKIFGLVTYSDMYDYFNFNEGFEETSGDWAICPPPFSTRVNADTGFIISKDSPNKDLLGPLVEWITLDCSEEGLQYSLATGTLFNGETTFRNEKISVISGNVMKNVDGTRDVLGGQNANTVVYDILKNLEGQHQLYNTYPDNFITWLDAADAYIKGEKDKEALKTDFIDLIKEKK